MLSDVIRAVTLAVGAALSVYTLYFGVIALRGLVRRAPAFARTAPQKRIACVVAARNEAAVIGPLVDSLFAQDYPRALFEVIVAPNNCTDDTEAVAAAHGARIFRPTGPIRSKGDVLAQVVDEVVLKENFDAMCVFDADNLAGRQFLARMNDALCAGAQAAQGFRDSKNPEQTAISGCYSICYWMVNRFYNAARASLGLSALVNGSGFAVSTGLLRALGGWRTVTMTEDYEFSAQCALNGHKVHFVPDGRRLRRAAAHLRAELAPAPPVDHRQFAGLADLRPRAVLARAAPAQRRVLRHVPHVPSAVRPAGGRGAGAGGRRAAAAHGRHRAGRHRAARALGHRAAGGRFAAGVHAGHRAGRRADGGAEKGPRGRHVAVRRLVLGVRAQPDGAHAAQLRLQGEKLEAHRPHQRQAPGRPRALKPANAQKKRRTQSRPLCVRRFFVSL